MDNLRVILIGGSSHTGKTNLARALSTLLGWEMISTDYLARHPGRPWRNNAEPVPPHVIEHYSALPVAELFADVLRHYQRLWPEIQNLITAHSTDFTLPPILIEGSALWPEFVAPVLSEYVRAIWLTAGGQLFQKRIYAESRFESAAPNQQYGIQKFLERTLFYNQKMMESVVQLGLMSVTIDEHMAAYDLAKLCLQAIKP